MTRSFEQYVLERGYNSGRGSRDAWLFILRAKGEQRLRAIHSWEELARRLAECGADERLSRGAKAAWRSYQHQRWRRLQAPEYGAYRGYAP